jgi:hypothetical protein
MGKSPDTLVHFLSLLNTNAYTVVPVPFEYDTGIPPFATNSEWGMWCAENNFSWWIGISLGASLAYTFASLLNEIKRPKRLTLINPFASRETLAKEKTFSINGQWNFSPIAYALNLKKIDMVISVFDEKIPIYHGVSLLNKAVSDRKSLIFVDDNHQIQNEAAQKELAELLISGESVKKGDNCGKTCYCNVYQQ